MKDRTEKACRNFGKGYNCAQSVVLAFSDILPVDKSSLLKLSGSFGAGIGRMREVCGAVSGMAMVLGLLYGYEDPEAKNEKKEHYERVQELCRAFEEKNRSLVCRDLLKLSKKHDDPTPEERTEKYYSERPCERLVACAAELLDEYIKTHPF